MTPSQQIISLLDLDQLEKVEHHEDMEGVAAVHTVTRPVLPSSLPTRQDEKKADAAELIAPLRPVSRPFVYPEWPTSQPGPKATLPPLGQHPHPRRTDQMVYESYDQERGEQSSVPVRVPLTGKQRDKTYLPDASLQDLASTAQQEQ